MELSFFSTGDHHLSNQSLFTFTFAHSPPLQSIISARFFLAISAAFALGMLRSARGTIGNFEKAVKGMLQDELYAFFLTMLVWRKHGFISTDVKYPTNLFITCNEETNSLALTYYFAFPLYGDLHFLKKSSFES